jgi:hypothetical protein
LLQKLWNPDEMLHYHTHNTEFFRRILLPAASVRAGNFSHSYYYYRYSSLSVMYVYVAYIGKRVDQLTSIIDLNGLGRHHLTKAAYNFLSSVSKVDQVIPLHPHNPHPS